MTGFWSYMQDLAYAYIGLLGLFYFTARPPLDMKYGPDWIFFQEGFPHPMHIVIGMFLFLLAIFLFNEKYNFFGIKD